MRSLLYCSIYIICNVIHAISSKSIDGDFKIKIYYVNGSHVREKILTQSQLWIQFQSIVLPNETYWLKIKIKNEIHYPVLVKSKTKGNYTLPRLPRSMNCHYVAVSHLMTHKPTAKQTLQNNRLSIGAQYQPISLCYGISGIIFGADDKSLVKIESSGREDLLDFAHLTEIPILSHDDVIRMTEYSHFRDVADKKLHRVRRSPRMSTQALPGPFLVELYLVVDSKMVTMYGADNYSELLSRITIVLNQMNIAFMQFNIYFTIVQLEIWEQDPIKLTDENHIIMELQLYKRQFIEIKHDCLHAILGENLGSAKRGQSEPASMCAYNRCVGYTKDHKGLGKLEIAHAVIHEIGHNFGLQHDTELCKCFGCIMATGVEFGILKFQWSMCSMRQISSLLTSGMADCLRDEPRSQLSKLEPIILSHNRRTKLSRQYIVTLCGNGIVDDGEGCDCGGKVLCSAAAKRCCNPETCQLRIGAVCASGECCDVSRCSPKSAGTVCRSFPNRDCDLPEYCDGSSEWCPSDVYKDDGVSCKTTTLLDSSHCYHGECHSRQSRCQALYGDTADEAASSCYDMNRIGDDIKNCGLVVPQKDELSRHPMHWNTRPCTDDNLLCGRLWCSHFNERVIRTSPMMEADVQVGSHYCSAARFYLDWYLDDAGLVPNGSPCGSGKMCWRGSCVTPPLSTASSCYCNEHGVCNNRKHCHCDPGFAPPNCTSPGNGGSIDSGSPQTFNRRSRFIIAGVFITIVILLAILIVGALLYHYNTGKWPPLLDKIKWPENQKLEFIIESKEPNKFGRQDSKLIRCSMTPISDKDPQSPRSPIYRNFSDKSSSGYDYPKILTPTGPMKKKMFMYIPEDKSLNFQNPTLKPLKPLCERPQKPVASPLKPLVSKDKPMQNVIPKKPPVSADKPVKPSNVSQIQSQLNLTTQTRQIRPPLLSSKPTISKEPPPSHDSTNLPNQNPSIAKPPLLTEKPVKPSTVTQRPPILVKKPSADKKGDPNNQADGSNYPRIQPINVDKPPSSTRTALIGKIAKVNISAPKLDQTTCNILTREISSPDQKLSRFIGPHKIIKIDPNAAVKYLY